MATTAEPTPTTVSKAADGPTIAKAWGTDAADQPLRPMEVERRALRPNDVAIKITYAGICHSDLHTCRNDWGGSRYPVIPGHEIVGTVTAVGDEVTRHRVGETVAVGCMVDSCMECDQCRREMRNAAKLTGAQRVIDVRNRLELVAGYPQ
jgi:uncharacterized zinc-type alcohol dehydrogenase-like protein